MSNGSACTRGGRDAGEATDSEQRALEVGYNLRCVSIHNSPSRNDKLIINLDPHERTISKKPLVSHPPKKNHPSPSFWSSPTVSNTTETTKVDDHENHQSESMDREECPNFGKNSSLIKPHTLQSSDSSHLELQYQQHKQHQNEPQQDMVFLLRSESLENLLREGQQRYGPRFGLSSHLFPENTEATPTPTPIATLSSVNSKNFNHRDLLQCCMDSKTFVHNDSCTPFTDRLPQMPKTTISQENSHFNDGCHFNDRYHFKPIKTIPITSSSFPSSVSTFYEFQVQNFNTKVPQISSSSFISTDHSMNNTGTDVHDNDKKGIAQLLQRSKEEEEQPLHSHWEMNQKVHKASALWKKMLLENNQSQTGWNLQCGSLYHNNPNAQNENSQSIVGELSDGKTRDNKHCRNVDICDSESSDQTIGKACQKQSCGHQWNAKIKKARNKWNMSVSDLWKHQKNSKLSPSPLIEDTILREWIKNKKAKARKWTDLTPDRVKHLDISPVSPLSLQTSSSSPSSSSLSCSSLLTSPLISSSLPSSSSSLPSSLLPSSSSSSSSLPSTSLSGHSASVESTVTATAGTTLSFEKQTLKKSVKPSKKLVFSGKPSRRNQKTQMEDAYILRWILK